MAIRIVEEKPDPDVVKRKVCKSCGVTLEYVPADERRKSHTDYTGDTTFTYLIDCPKCGAEVVIRSI